MRLRGGLLSQGNGFTPGVELEFDGEPFTPSAGRIRRFEDLPDILTMETPVVDYLVPLRHRRCGRSQRADIQSWHERNDSGGTVELRRQRDKAMRRDPAALEFFSSSKHEGEPKVSEFGSKLTSGYFRVNGRHVGQVIQLRTYSGLDTGTSGDAGGFSAPILFWKQVIARLQQIDELFLAARWIDTPTGGLFDMPLADDSSNVGAAVVETTGPVVEGPNPSF